MRTADEVQSRTLKTTTEQTLKPRTDSVILWDFDIDSHDFLITTVHVTCNFHSEALLLAASVCADGAGVHAGVLKTDFVQFEWCVSSCHLLTEQTGAVDIILILTVELVLTVVEAVNNIQSTLPGDNGAFQIPWAVHREGAGEDQRLTVEPSDSVSRNSNLKLS